MIKELFLCVLGLSFTGALVTAVLLLIKRIMLKRISAKTLWILWMIALICFVVPIWKCVPHTDIHVILPNFEVYGVTVNDTALDAAVHGYADVNGTDAIDILKIASYIWLFGTCVFLIMSLVSYVLFLYRKKSSIELESDDGFERAKHDLSIKRKIRLRISLDMSPPMLVGAFFPILYIPSGAHDDDSLQMMLRHELMHYKHKDLLYKLISLFVNAVHWFDPFTYLLCRNISQACELYCDESVTKDLNEDEKRRYMRVILDMATRRKGR